MNAIENAIESVAARLATPRVHWIALLSLCMAYVQGGIVKAIDFSGAIAEMNHFGFAPTTEAGVHPRASKMAGSAPSAVVRDAKIAASRPRRQAVPSSFGDSLTNPREDE